MQVELKMRQIWCVVGEKEALLETLDCLVREAESHGAAAGLVEAVVVPDVAACAAAGLNHDHIEVLLFITPSHHMQHVVPCNECMLLAYKGKSGTASCY